MSSLFGRLSQTTSLPIPVTTCRGVLLNMWGDIKEGKVNLSQTLDNVLTSVYAWPLFLRITILALPHGTR